VTATADIGTSVADLPATPADGEIAQLRLGDTPYDFLGLVYDATYGKWVSQPQVVKTSTAVGHSVTSTSYANYATDSQTVAIVPQGSFDAAGLGLQVRNFCIANADGTHTFSLSGRVTGYNDGGSDSTTLAPPFAVASTTSAVRVGCDSGWTDCLPSPITDYMNFGWQVKVTGGSGAILHAGMLLRWVA